MSPCLVRCSVVELPSIPHNLAPLSLPSSSVFKHMGERIPKVEVGLRRPQGTQQRISSVPGYRGSVHIDIKSEARKKKRSSEAAVQGSGLSAEGGSHLSAGWATVDC